MTGTFQEIPRLGGGDPLVVFLIALGVVLGVVLATSACLVLGISLYRSRRDARMAPARREVKAELLDRLFAEDPEWESWVEGLSGTRRRATERLLDGYLRELEGREADRLRDLGDALGIPEREADRLTSDDEYERLRALTWLVLLERPGPYRHSTHEPETPRERAAVARLLLTDDATEAGDVVSMLLAEPGRAFSAFGQDALYRAAEEDPAALLEVAAREYREWPRPLVVQVLTVCSHLETTLDEEGIAWLTASLEHGDPDVRVASARALGNFGWDESLRDRAFLERVVDDPSPTVRGAVYEMLADWGDDSASSALLFALVTEEHPRALTRGLNALASRREGDDESAADAFGNSWEWCLEQASYDRLARRRVPEVAG